MDAKVYLTVAAICRNPLRSSLSVVSGPRIPVFQQFRGAPGRLVSAVLRCGDFGMGADRLVCKEFSRLVRRAQRPNCQRCRACGQHRHKRLGDCDGLAQCDCVGIDGRARAVVGWGSLPALCRRVGGQAWAS
jgi:hypothetical protein